LNREKLLRTQAHGTQPELSSLTGRLAAGKHTRSRTARASWIFCGTPAIADEQGDFCPNYRTENVTLHDLPGDAVAEKLGMVKRFDFGDVRGRVELVEEGDDGHHHHLICTRCAKRGGIEECFPAEIGNGSRATTLSAVTHRLEFFGICPDRRNENGGDYSRRHFKLFPRTTSRRVVIFSDFAPATCRFLSDFWYDVRFCGRDVWDCRRFANDFEVFSS